MSKNEVKGVKLNKLARFDLIPVKPLWLLAELYGIGAEKYTNRNWENGYQWSQSYQALQRHLNQWWAGESIDPVDGQHHLASAMWHCAALLEFEETHPDLDDRPRQVKLESKVTNQEELDKLKKI